MLSAEHNNITTTHNNVTTEHKNLTTAHNNVITAHNNFQHHVTVVAFIILAAFLLYAVV